MSKKTQSYRNRNPDNYRRSSIMSFIGSHIGTIILVVFFGLVSWAIYKDTKADNLVDETLRSNLKTHTNTIVSKVSHSGLDVHYSKHGESFSPTFLLEDGTILSDSQFDDSQLIPFIKEGSVIEYTTELDKRTFNPFTLTMAHIKQL